MLRDVAGAEKKFRKAAEQGDPVAQFKLGHAYYLEGTESGDFEEALHWIRNAAAQDHDTAQAHLGYMYLSGKGVPIDSEGSKTWFRRAAEQGNSFHQYQYATMCWNGDFGDRDTREAEVWWLKAADQGRATAHHTLGDFYGGEFSPPENRDLIESYKWLTLAALQDTPGHSPKASRSARDRIAENMTSQEISDAEGRLEKWLQDHPEVMGEEMVEVWRERIAEPLTPEEIAEADERVRAWMEAIERGEDPFAH